MKKVLVAYATWTGASHEVATKIAEVLKHHKMQADVTSADQVRSIEEYYAILLGTSIHAGQTAKAFRQFLKRFHHKLSIKPLGIFVVCGNMMEDTEKNQAETMEWLQHSTEKYPKLKPVSLGFFGGALITEGDDFNNLNFLIRKIILSMRESWIKEYGKTDFRDWQKIFTWAEDIVKKL